MEISVGISEWVGRKLKVLKCFKNHFEFAEVVLPRMHIYVCYKYHLKMLFLFFCFRWASLVVPIGSRGKLEVGGGVWEVEVAAMYVDHRGILLQEVVHQHISTN